MNKNKQLHRMKYIYGALRMYMFTFHAKIVSSGIVFLHIAYTFQLQ